MTTLTGQESQSLVTTLVLSPYSRGGQLGELREPHFRRRLRHKPCINKIKHIFLI
jgi:hypothetical protein